MNDFLILSIVVIVFSAVQSLFGVGLLVFGTPTLLLLGYSFETTIAMLLPSSMIISLIQVLQGKEHIKLFKKNFLIYSVPFIVVGLWLVLTEFLVIDMKFLVGVILVFSAIIRFNRRTQNLLARFVRSQLKSYLIAMGLVHGLSNMGGGFLTVLITSMYKDKEATRANIAYGYLIFAFSQIAVLLVFQPMSFTTNSLIFPVIAISTFYTIGNTIYLKSSRSLYQHMITAFILAYGIILIGDRFFRGY